MTERYLDPTNDVAFKKIFMDEHKLRDFLNAVLRLPEGRKIEELAFLPQEEVPDIGQGKRSMFDIKCRDEKGNWFIIEMQNGRKPHFLKRVQFYGAHTYVSQLKTGLLHSGLMPVIVVVVVRESLFPKSVEYISYHRTKEEKTNTQHLFELSYVFIELSKFTKKKKDLKTPEDYWLDFLANSTSESAPPEQLDDPHVLAAYEAIERFNWPQESFDAYLKARLLAEAEVMALDYRFEKGVAKGEAIGLAKGKAEGIRQTAIPFAFQVPGLSAFGIQSLSRTLVYAPSTSSLGFLPGFLKGFGYINMLKRKKTDEEICQDTGYSVDELAKLKQQHKL